VSDVLKAGSTASRPGTAKPDSTLRERELDPAVEEMPGLAGEIDVKTLFRDQIDSGGRLRLIEPPARHQQKESEQRRTVERNGSPDPGKDFGFQRSDASSDTLSRPR